MELVRTEDEIYHLLDDCMDHEMNGTTQFSGMTFEEGVRAAIEWMTDKGMPHPFE